MTKLLDIGHATRQRKRYIALGGRQREKQTRNGGNIGTRETKRDLKIETDAIRDTEGILEGGRGDKGTNENQKNVHPETYIATYIPALYDFFFKKK